jgi:hypothetical protein
MVTQLVKVFLGFMEVNDSSLPAVFTQRAESTGRITFCLCPTRAVLQPGGRIPHLDYFNILRSETSFAV